MRDSVKKGLLLGSIVAVILVYFLVQKLTSATSYVEKYEGYDLTVDAEGAVREGTYTLYQNAHADAAYPAATVEVDLAEYISGEDIELYMDYEGYETALYTGEESTVTWEIEIEEAGWYNICMEYMTVESRGVEVERSVYINGELPFDDAATCTFSRIWTDDGESTYDNQGNEIRASQIEIYEWQISYFKDDMGYITEPYQFYFEEGVNTITIEAQNEPVIIGRLTVTAVTETATYEEYLASHTEDAATGEGLTYSQTIEGEDSTKRSESSLYAKYDKASATTSPYSVTTTVLNYTGGDAWSTPGQWIEWEFEVPEDGYYNITIKARQNYERGSVSSRILTIDGEIPFEEMKTVSFEYSNDWQCVTLADENGEAYSFYLTAGTHTIRLEATEGEMGAILEELEDSVYRLNQIYRTLLVYLGASPDTYRDYNIADTYPEVIEAMELEYRRLYKIVDEVQEYTGQKAQNIATAQTLAQQLERFVAKDYKISEQFTTFKDNITSLGTAILNMTTTKLDIDYIVVSGTEAEEVEDSAGILAGLVHEVKSFVATFTVDYDTVGDVYDEDDEEVITVWVTTGRDQGTILKTMIDDTFTPETGIKVNVEIVDINTLLSAVVAGRGPEVVLSVGASLPVDYALRDAAEDLTQFDDLDEVLENFSESSYLAYQVDDSLYALPETVQFNVLYYRTDILEELGLSVPETWDELIEMLPTIQGNNMSVGIPSAANSASSGGTAADLTMYYTLLLQYGGDVYNEDGTATAVNDETGVEAYSDYLDYFTDYGIPTIYDFVSRFRSGEMPIGIASFSTYNTLMVSAPEIKGLWDFTTVPGTERTDEDGNTYIDYSDYITGTATMMLKTEDEDLKNSAWEFMKWWTSTDTQTRFGREMEALLGSSARYATANVNAFSQLAWSRDELEVLMTQWDSTVGIREVPGGYYTSRYLTNAIRKVINDSTDPRETILDYALTINEELTRKRLEFGLSTG